AWGEDIIQKRSNGYARAIKNSNCNVAAFRKSIAQASDLPNSRTMPSDQPRHRLLVMHLKPLPSYFWMRNNYRVHS
ncbi:MAG: hypothetical protein QG670_685, partial [Thermoproteota archaeon]|nr:hypothetical protein [Thermoproteota archaeon]